MLPYQTRLGELTARFPYRLDTNFAKMDRIVHPEIEDFKSRVYATAFHGRAIEKWNKLLSRGKEAEIRLALAQRFGIGDDGGALVE